MKRPFRVSVAEVHFQDYYTEAESPEQAKANIQQGDGTIIEWEMEYSHTLDVSEWLVEEIPEKDLV